MQTRLMRILAMILIFLTSAVITNAQDPVAIRNVVVNVDLRDVTGVSPNPPSGSGVVDFIYQTTADYNDDKTVAVIDQLRVTSTGAYNILVRGGGNFTGTTSSANTLPLNILRTSARSSGTGSYSAEVTPTTTDQPLITGAPATTDQGYDISYRIPQNATLLTAAKDIYTTNLIYSITAQ